MGRARPTASITKSRGSEVLRRAGRPDTGRSRHGSGLLASGRARQRRVAFATRIAATTITSRISGTISHIHHQFLPLLELLVPEEELWPTVLVLALLLPPEVLLMPPVLLTDPSVLLPPEVLLTPPLLLTVPPVLPVLEPVLEVVLELRPPLLEVELELELELELTPPLLLPPLLTPPLLLPPLLTPPDARPGAATDRVPSPDRPSAAVRSEVADRSACCTYLPALAAGAVSDAAYAVPAEPASKAHSSSADVPTRMFSPVVVVARASMTGLHERRQAAAASAARRPV
ncbi:hypothetical protein ACFPA8_09810 [Streptomyces ovatisporus]|uniref:Uncharacterized protein n=1 Tax=Streptomyces ovatisporus TaxID=1128682 RepID=A0ABV9AA02_9ACTN